MNNNELNPFVTPQQGQTLQSVTAAMATTRQAQEVQAAMVVAKHFPRNQAESMNRILDACARPSLAEAATYEYNRGGSKIYGPSIRLAECIAQNWGNIDFGFMELDRKERESSVMAYAWDLETNSRRSQIFTVKHQRDVGSGSKAVTSERDIYEVIANQAQRRVRACILALIPGDVIDRALKGCELAMKAKEQGVPIEQRIADMITAFAEYEIQPAELAAFCGKQGTEYLDDADLRRLRKAYTSLRDGIVGSDYFTDRMRKLGAEQAAKQATVATAAPQGAGDTTPTQETAQEAYGGPSGELPFEMGLNDL